jgi:L-aminopeptidase/D-esterase-like protein
MTMSGSITDVAGITVGHAEDRDALTGCTVVLCGDGAVVGVSVRGLAPGTRETDLCRPGTLVERAHAVLLTGGSAFGLEAAGGVMRFLRERRIGFPTGVLPVPIVPAAVIFDLGIGEPVWPDAEMAYKACLGARDDNVRQGNAGAGMGATVGKILGPGQATKSGIGTASIRVEGVAVAALMVVNAFGDVLEEGGSVLAGPREPSSGAFVSTRSVLTAGSTAVPGTNTTIGVVATDALLTSDQVNHLAAVAHDGLARRIQPVHTPADGDTVFALATGRSDAAASLMVLCAATVECVERAILNAVLTATAAGGLPAARR